jgi:hypothetical protein
VILFLSSAVQGTIKAHQEAIRHSPNYQK